VRDALPDRVERDAPTTSRPVRPLACVMGDMEIIRPLGLAGIPCAAVAPLGDPARYSRFTKVALDSPEGTHEPSFLERLVSFAGESPRSPILFYETDRDSLLISRNRELLDGPFRFVIPEATLVEELLDKARFQQVAARLGLPVPPSLHLRPASSPPPNLEFPVILKPLIRQFELWSPIAGDAKALRVDSHEALDALWPRFAAAGMELVAQEFVEGPESLVESYHVYVDQAGETAAEFTGRKIRTYPVEYGHSTALVTTDSADVLAIGREVTAALRLRGVAKLDFKRGPNGALQLLEVNPRFSLWHHLGALAGVNIPAVVYADLADLPRPEVGQAKVGVRWSRPWLDFLAARASRVSARQWLSWTLGSEAKSLVSFDDPMPLLRGKIWESFARRFRS
jgi:D-aspartate ligase